MRQLKTYLLIAFSLLELRVLGEPPPVPSAGVVERELEKEYEAKPMEPEKQIPAIQIDIPRERLELPAGRKVSIRDIMIEGNDSIPESELRRCVEGRLNREMTLKEIYDLCECIDQYYAAQGYILARAYPPPQQIQDGILVIQVIEGKLGKVEVLGNQHYTSSFIQGYFTDLQGKPLLYNDFLKALMLLNENSDLMAGAVFEKGKEFGYADVIVQVKDKRPIHLYLNGNNYGKDLTTNFRAGGRFNWGNVAAQGDMLSIAEVVGFPMDALYFTDVTYTIPLNKTGASLEAAYLFSKFKVEELTSLHLKGQSNIATLKYNQALLRRRSLSLNFFSYFDYKQIQNFEGGTRVSFDKLRVLTAGTLIDHYSSSQGRDYLTLRLAAGIPNFLGGLKAVDSECSRIGGGGRFFKFNVDYDRLQRLPRDSFFYFHGSGQLSPSKLTLPEQIYIGGSDTVRGYPLAVALGDSGYYVNFEFRVPPPFLANKNVFGIKKKWKEVLQFDLFLDHGGVFLKSAQNTFLWGTGAGLKINGPYTLTLSVDVGFPLNHKKLSHEAFTYIKITGQPF